MSHHEAQAPDPHGGETKKKPGPIAWLFIVLGAAVMGYLVYYNIAHLHDGHGGGHGAAEAPAMWGVGILPFVALLGCIAVLPLIPATHHWWESNMNRFIVAMLCAGGALLYYLLTHGADSILPVLNHAVPAEYVPFIVLLFSLYVISGGINLKGDLAAHPITNTGFLAFGAIIASFIGTTGASMLLIRPLLQTNCERKHVVHTVIFFIFLVSNIGGTLLPIGDPPLFLGYLRGVEFFWTFNLWIEWAVCCGILLTLYFLLDSYHYKKEEAKDIRRDETERQPLRLSGAVNILWLAGIVACVAMVNHETTLINKPLTGATTIAQLNGGRGAEHARLDIMDSSGAQTTIDLADVNTADDIVAAFNGSADVSVEASLGEQGFVITDRAGGDGRLMIQNHAARVAHEGAEASDAAHEGDEAHHELHVDTTAESLGLVGESEGGVLTGHAVNPGWTPFPFLREVLMFLLVGLSLITTPRGVRKANDFNYAAIIEVAALFIGIFIAMQVPIEVLRVYGPALGLSEPWHFFWATGSLSSFLDNAPTYVVFFETAASFESTKIPVTVISEPLLIGISLGAVFMGAMTYIGNGPNFMVKAIAEQSGLKMPSFFGYMFKYSIPMLIPVFIIITLVFLRGGHAPADAATDDEHQVPAVSHVDDGAGAALPHEHEDERE
jgi:Na+/H+ antiporter NhaD/arsenite permease-like protein